MLVLVVFFPDCLLSLTKFFDFLVDDLRLGIGFPAFSLLLFPFPAGVVRRGTMGGGGGISCGLDLDSSGFDEPLPTTSNSPWPCLKIFQVNHTMT